MRWISQTCVPKHLHNSVHSRTHALACCGMMQQKPQSNIRKPPTFKTNTSDHFLKRAWLSQATVAEHDCPLKDDCRALAAHVRSPAGAGEDGEVPDETSVVSTSVLMSFLVVVKAWPGEEAGE